MLPFDRALSLPIDMTFYCNYGCISVVSEIPVFNVVKYRDLEIPVKSQSRLWKVRPFDRLGMISY